MKWIKFIIGGGLFISSTIQLIKLLNSYFTLPFDQIPFGAEIGTGAMMLAGILIFRSGLKKEEKPSA
ncbi:hypothetical protein [Solitalea lacus]|uniref:hypothetical protein n=1 Tax=Solitalea lacus TaxID=2911172 RepID=UPI001EDB5FC0|nr:hypothetical protein [Solitalea lacus]UKJ06952.1 hypothetical protein L2B55_15650 [Solitalea lacus]